MNIILIRHPISEGNLEGTVQHALIGEIHARGHAQIEQLCKRIQQEPYDMVYASDAERCRILAERLAALRQTQPKYNSLFREIDNGEWYTRKKSDMNRLLWKDPFYTRPPGGESINDVWIRAQEALRYIESRGQQRVVLISHAVFFKCLVGSQLGMGPLKAYAQLKFSNCALSEIRQTEHGWMIEYLNNREYLRT